MRPLLIDTNAYSAFKRKNKDIVTLIQHADVLGFSSVVIGELLAGFAVGSQTQKNRSELNGFLSSSRIRIYTVTEDTANYYAQIYATLRQKGQPIPIV